MVSLKILGHNANSRAMAVSPIQPLTEMSTRNMCWRRGGKGWRFL